MTDPREVEELCMKAAEYAGDPDALRAAALYGTAGVLLSDLAATLRALVAERDELRAKAMGWESHASHVVEDNKALTAQLAAARADVEQCLKQEVSASADGRTAVFVERVLQRDGSFLWRIADSYGGALDKSGVWWCEPPASERSDDYLASTRWASREEAVAFARAAIGAAKGGA